MKLENFFKEQIEGETHTLVAPPHNYTLSDGRTIINFHLNPEAMEAEGWREWTEEELEAWHTQYDPPVTPYVRQRCTKYQLVTCLRSFYPELLAQLRTSYSSNSDLQFFWNTVQDLDRTNPDFRTAQEALNISDEQVAEIFEKIEGEEPVMRQSDL